MKGIWIYGEEMISVDDAEEMIADAFDAGRGMPGSGSSAAVGCSFAFRSVSDILRLADLFGVPEIREGDVFEVSDILRLADLFGVPEIREGDVFEFGISGIERVES